MLPSTTSASNKAVNVLIRMFRICRMPKTLLVLRTSDRTNLVKLVKCPKGGGRCSTENQFQAWVNSGLFEKSPI